MEDSNGQVQYEGVYFRVCVRACMRACCLSVCVCLSVTCADGWLSTQISLSLGSGTLGQVATWFSVMLVL